MCINSGYQSFSRGFDSAFDQVGGAASYLGIAGHRVCSGIYSVAAPVGRGCKSAALKTARFVKENKYKLLASIVAWGVIVGCTGFLYGFQAVSLPLSIGIGSGILFGGLFGLLTVKVLDPQQEYNGKNTLWDLINKGVRWLDQNGTKQIVLAVAVTVLLASSVVFPHALGAVFGLVIGNHIITKIGFGLPLGADPSEIRDALHQRLIIVENEMKQIRAIINTLPKSEKAESDLEEEKTDQQKFKELSQQLQILQQTIEELQKKTEEN
ncbi:MAG: hypothetical protein K940chlam9_01123 [Chlamydiae bacterium]|nr:hypothetical protein [Chlamydiota bacterium]